MQYTHRTLGYTLIELIVAMGISAVILAALLYFFSGSITSYRSQVGHVFATADARTQLQRIVDSLRNAQDNLVTSDVWLLEAKDDSIIVWTDISGDGALEKVQYARSTTDATQLVRTILVGSDTGTTIVAQRLNTSTPLFVYYDANGSIITELSDRTSQAVETIGVTFVVSVSESTDSQTITTKVTPRQKLQGTVSQTGNANGDREVTIELPRGNPPAATDPARLIIKDITTGAVVVDKDIPIATLNDGRLRAYGTNDYALVNYKNSSPLGLSPRWYVWLTWGVPVQQLSGAVALDYFYNNVGSAKTECLGKTLSQALSSSDCAAQTYPWGVPYKPILTYTENGFKDHVMDIFVKRPVLQSFTSTSANGTYGPGSTITVKATYDIALANGSTLTVRMDTGANVTLSAVSGTTVSGTYTVGATGSGENTSDLNVSSIESESVTDTLTPANTRTNSTVPASPNNIWDTSNIIVDTAAPEIPTATPPGGTYSATTSVELSAETAASIRYTLDGSDPVSSSSLYSAPLSLTPPKTLKAIAQDAAGNISPIRTERYKLPFIDGGNAIALIGQYVNQTDNPLVPNYTKNAINDGQASVNQLGLSYPSVGLVVDTVGDRLFATDSNNHRVLVFNLNADDTLIDTIPDFVLGQSNFTSGSSATSASRMSLPFGLAYDTAGKRLFVADGNNNRVLVFDVATITNGENAVKVLGQSTFTANSHSVSRSRMRFPNGLAYDAASDRLFVADSLNNRVLVFNVAAISNGENAVNVLGQTGFTSTSSATTQSGLTNPTGLAYNSFQDHLFVVDYYNNRVLVFDIAAISNGENAVNVIGQSSFTSGSSATSQSRFFQPYDVGYDGTNNRVYVSDTANHRIMIFTAP